MDVSMKQVGPSTQTQTNSLLMAHRLPPQNGHFNETIWPINTNINKTQNINKLLMAYELPQGKNKTSLQEMIKIRSKSKYTGTGLTILINSRHPCLF